MQTREERLQAVKEHPEVSVLIIGAGINGIGTFRDLAYQGVDVVMIDKNDYCSGASAASSHMVHGGIRYLENGEFKLVKEAVRERNLMIENIPHLVKPLPTTFPIFKWFSGLLNAPLKFLGLLNKPAERGAIVIKIGMVLYDAFTGKQKTVPPHTFRNRKESLALFPALNPNVIFTGTYYDGAMPSPERIALEVLMDAAEETPQAIPLNYTSFVSAQGDTVTVKDEISGELLQIKPKILINAAGPWIDIVNKEIGASTHFISGTKGSHLILDHPELREAIGENEFFFENKDGRIVLIFPLEDKVMVGTSDIRVDDPNDIVITNEEIRYFFDMIGRVFPKIKIDHSQIVYTFSGVRPLQHSEKDATGQISRNHKVNVIEAGEVLNMPILSLIGGKWTSFRAFSEHATDITLDLLHTGRKISTEGLQVGGSKGYPESEGQKTSYLAALENIIPLPADRLETLFSKYGTKTTDLLEKYGAEISTMCTYVPDTSVAEIKYIAAEMDVVHLDDLILRRTILGKLGKITSEGLAEIADICAQVFDWSEAQKSQEMDRYRSVLKKAHRMDFTTFLGE